MQIKGASHDFGSRHGKPFCGMEHGEKKQYGILVHAGLLNKECPLRHHAQLLSSKKERHSSIRLQEHAHL